MTTLSTSSFQTQLKPFDLHVFVCTNVRKAAPNLPDGSPAPPPKQSCGSIGGEDVRASLKEWLGQEMMKRNKLSGRVNVRVNGSGCLHFCKKGIVVAVYPQSEFMFFVKNSTDSLESVKKQILSQLDELESRV